MDAVAVLRVAGELPVPLTDFIGRTSELDALARLVLAHRLVTATGPGGVGKTRLAVAVAGSVREEFRDGVVFVDLVTVTDAAMVVIAMADAASVSESAGTGLRRDLG